MQLRPTPDEALRMLIDGNQRFINGIDESDSFLTQDKKMAGGQTPYACILGCSDSRVSPEHAFDEGHGNLFVTRIAGNFVTPEIIASLEYGTSVLGAQLILVLGHTGCGAINAAIKVCSTQAKTDGRIGTLISHLEPAITETHNEDLASWKQSATLKNVIKNVDLLRSSDPILSKRVKDGLLKVVGGIYNLKTGIVEIVDS